MRSSSRIFLFCFVDKAHDARRWLCYCFQKVVRSPWRWTFFQRFDSVAHAGQHGRPTIISTIPPRRSRDVRPQQFPSGSIILSPPSPPLQENEQHLGPATLISLCPSEDSEAASTDPFHRRSSSDPVRESAPLVTPLEPPSEPESGFALQ